MVAHDVSEATITITARDPKAEIVPYPANLQPLYDDDLNDVRLAGQIALLPKRLPMAGAGQERLQH